MCREVEQEFVSIILGKGKEKEKLYLMKSEKARLKSLDMCTG